MKDKRLSSKINCWEYKQCGREPGGQFVAELCVCPAAIFTALPDGQYNSGEYIGRRCWRIAGTLCNSEIQGVFAKKIQSCRRCDFYRQVRKEEGKDFIE